MRDGNGISFEQTNSGLNEADESLLSLLAHRNFEQQKDLEQYRRRLADVQTELTSVKKEAQQRKEDLEEIKDNIKNVQNKTLEPLAVFVGLFTFVSVGFNIFSNIKTTSLWVSLLLIILGALIIFSALVIHAGSLNSRDKSRRRWTASLIVIGILILIAGSIIHGINLNSPQSQNEQKEQDDCEQTLNK